MKVISAVLSSNENVFHASWKENIKGTLEPKRYIGIDMSLTGQGVKLSYKGKTVLVPIHRFDSIELEADLNALPKKVSK